MPERAGTRGYERSFFRRLAFRLALLYIFVKFGLIHEFIAYKFNSDTRLLLLIGAPLILTTLLSGAVPRAFRFRTAYLWAAFGAWLVASVPFSFWPAGSLVLITGAFFRTTFPLLFVVAGLPASIRDVQKLFKVIAAAAICNGVVAALPGNDAGGRFALDFGTGANSGDLAAQFLLGLPFLWFTFLSYRSIILRAIVLGALVYNVKVALSTGTRAAIVAIAVSVAFLVLKGTMKQKVLVVVGALLITIAALFFLPENLLNRYGTFTEADTESTREAVGSTVSRLELLRRGLLYTLENPIFGVGPGVFADYDAARSAELGQPIMWKVTHNAYLGVISGAGIPAGLFFVFSILATFKLLRRSLAHAKSQEQGAPIVVAASCLRVAMIMLTTFMCFLSIAYSMYVPIFLGLGVAIARVTDIEILPEMTQGEPGQ